MKTGKLVKNRKNKEVFSFNSENLTYDGIYNLIKDIEYHTSGIDCDWNIIKIHDLKDDRDCYCLIFQESTSRTDWFHDFMFFPKKVKAYKGWKNRLVYHKGFYEEYQSARDVIKENLSPLLQDLAREQKCLISELKFYIIGWSLGGSIVPIACEDIFETYGIKSVIIPYEGANPCYNIHTRNYIMKCINTNESISFIYSNDIVPRLPPIFGRPLKDIRFYLDDHKCELRTTLKGGGFLFSLHR